MKQKRKARSLLAALLAALLLLAALPLSAYATAAPAADASLTVDLTGYDHFPDAVAALNKTDDDLKAVTTLTITGGFKNSKEWNRIDGEYLVQSFPKFDTLDMEGYTGTYSGYAFQLQNGFFNVKRLRLPAGVTISNNMLSRCRNLTTLVCGSGAWQDGVIDLTGAAGYGDAAFYYCFAITQVRLPDSIEIPGSMFIGCENLTTLVCGSGTMEPGVIDLTGYTGSAYGSSLFQDCSAIEQVRLPDSIDIPSAMFSQCTGLKALTFVGSSTNAPSVDTYAFHNVPTGGTLSYPAGAAGYDPLCDTQNTPVLNDWTRVPVAPPPPTPTPTPAAPAAQGTPHVCDFGGWQYSNEHHWKRCSCMALSDYAPHVFNSARVCTVCGYGAKPKKVNPPTGVFQ